MIHISTVFMIATYAAIHNFEIFTSDNIGAYLHSLTDRDMYAPIPSAYPIPEALKGKVDAVHFSRSTYGLRQSGALWATTLANALAACDFKRSIADPCLWIYKGRDGVIILATFVDDSLIIPSSKELLDKKMNELQKFVLVDEIKPAKT